MERKSRNRSAKAFARKMDKGLTKHFKEVFGREPGEGDSLAVLESAYGWAMANDNIVFTFVTIDGKLHTPGEMGFTKRCIHRDGKFYDED